MAKQKKTTIKLAQAFSELEEITNQLEKDDIDLEIALPQFKRAVKLASLIKAKLSQIENEINTISLDDYNESQDN
jgi:exodeoxyribonuclease VII small subunit